MEGLWRKALRNPCKPASLWMRPCTSYTHRPEEGREWGASRFYFPRLQSRFSFLTSWWIFRRHATISKSYYHRTENDPQIIRSLCLLFLFENLESLEGAFEKKKKLYPSWKSHQWATVGMPGYTHSQCEAESEYKGKSTLVKQGEKVLPHASQTSERYRDHLTAQAFTKNKKPSLNWLLLISWQMWYKSHLWNTARSCTQGYLQLTDEMTALDSSVSAPLFYCQEGLGCPPGLKFPRCGCGNSKVSSLSLWKATVSLPKHCCHFKCDLLVVTGMYLLV